MRERLGWRSLRSAFPSIWRMRSRVCSVAAGDAFLADFARIIDSSAFADSVLFITFDKGASNVVAEAVSPRLWSARWSAPEAATPRSAIATALFAPIEDAWGLGCLNQTCGVGDLRGLFGA